MLIEFFPSFAAERLEIRTLRASHGLIFCYPLVGIFLRFSAAGGTSGGTSSAFIKGRFVSAPAAGLAENSQSALRAMCRDARNYTAIQRLILRQDAICRELFERAIATAFTQFARQIRRFDQRIQASSSRGYIAERI